MTMQYYYQRSPTCIYMQQQQQQLNCLTTPRAVDSNLSIHLHRWLCRTMQMMICCTMGQQPHPPHTCGTLLMLQQNQCIACTAVQQLVSYRLCRGRMPGSQPALPKDAWQTVPKNSLEPPATGDTVCRVQRVKMGFRGCRMIGLSTGK